MASSSPPSSPSLRRFARLRQRLLLGSAPQPPLSALESLAPELQREIGVFVSGFNLPPGVTLASRACRQGFLAGVTRLVIRSQELPLQQPPDEGACVASLARLLGCIPDIEILGIPTSSVPETDRAVHVFALACRRYGRPFAKLEDACADAHISDYFDVSRKDADHLLGQLLADGFFPALTSLRKGLLRSRVNDLFTPPRSLLLLWQQALERGHLSQITEFTVDAAKDNDPVCNGLLNAPGDVLQRQAPVVRLEIKASAPVTDACRQRLEAMLRLTCFAQLRGVEVNASSTSIETTVFAVLAGYIRATGGAPALDRLYITPDAVGGGLGPALVQALGGERGAPNLTELKLYEAARPVFADLGAIFAAEGLVGLRRLHFTDPYLAEDGSDAAALLDGLRASPHRGQGLEDLTVDAGEIKFLKRRIEAFEVQFAMAQSAGAVPNAKLEVMLPWQNEEEEDEDENFGL